MAVKFEELKTGDKIARRFMRLEGDTLVKEHYQPHTVLGAVGHANRMLHLKAEDGHEYTIHEGLHIGINDELRTWDRV
jgi:hypothetical protein